MNIKETETQTKTYQMKNNNPTTMSKFNYEKIRETDKAIFAKIPYWEETDTSKKKNKQLFYETWIPKYIIQKGDYAIKYYVIQGRNDIRNKNAYQKAFYKIPNSWNTMGECVKEKERKDQYYPDEEKIKISVQFLLEETRKKHPDLKLNGRGDFVAPPESMSELEIDIFSKKLKEAQGYIKTVESYVTKTDITAEAKNLSK